MPKLSGNKGEWSEVYVLLRLLDIGKLYAADENLNKQDNVFYNILNIVRKEEIGNLEFRVSKEKDKISVYNTDSNEELLCMNRTIFKEQADSLYNDIIKSNTSAFTIENTERFLNEMKINTLKAKSTDKADIRIKIHDINSGYESIQGFSIKSRLGSASTLINAGKTTNFIFEVENCNDSIAEKYNTFSKQFKERFTQLDEKCKLKYIGMENETFESNLILLDGSLPEICANMLIEYYKNGTSKVCEGLDIITEKNPMNFNMSKGQPFYSYKFKKLLTESALGMLPSKSWDGQADATGGYIIVREDGEVLCYHLFNRNEFENYLIKNTKFETPSTSRHRFGNIYKENGKFYLKLNLQIRFIK